MQPNPTLTKVQSHRSLPSLSWWTALNRTADAKVVVNNKKNRQMNARRRTISMVSL